MSHPRRPRSPLAQLLDAGKRRRGCDWPEIDAETGITKSTRESWLNGNVRDPGVTGVVRLAHALEIAPYEVFEVILFGEERMPPWVKDPRLIHLAPDMIEDGVVVVAQVKAKVSGPTDAEIPAEIAGVFAEKDAGRSKRPEGRGRRPRQNGHG